MSKKVEGVYPTLDGAMKAIERLKKQGYSREEITLVANEGTRKQLTKDEKTDIHTEQLDTEQMTHAEKTDSEDSLWDSIKDFFTIDDSNEDAELTHEEDPAYEYKEQIDQGQLVVVVDERVDQTNRSSMTNTQPNTIGPDGTRSYEEEQALGSKDDKQKDHELSTDELDNYERHQ
ncbi:MAG TPA: general stress protein [Candidatus Atopostipes pullistercoris]|uniref:General stress protein n=1 Tax=Candidatus Atopostipes pullistercoris TaxID=2838467 RepID=A0A9D2G1M9_9LACT|nr:general stress protein [Candidatus Atopostipes pullistercoris]